MKITLLILYSVIAANLQDWVARYWEKLGAPKEKIVIGMALYARGFTLAGNQTYSPIGAPARGPSQAGIYTREKGFVASFEVRQPHI